MSDRPFIHSNRCTLCGEFGIYADTRRCPDCEAVVNEARQAALREALEAIQTLDVPQPEMAVEVEDGYGRGVVACERAVRGLLGGESKG